MSTYPGRNVHVSGDALQRISRLGRLRPLLLHDDRLVIVQGTHVGGRAEYAEIAVPEGETLVAVKPEAILAAARALEGRSAS
jgi:hypothetical protein